MPLLPVFAINFWNCWLCLAIGFVLNALLCFVAKRHSNGALREYRPIVYYFCVMNITCLVLQAFAQPILFSSTNGRSFIFLCGIFALLPSIGLRIAAYSCYSVFTLATLASASLQFLDRYLVICRSNTKPYIRVAVLHMFQICFTVVIVLLNIETMPTVDYEIAEVLVNYDSFVSKEEKETMIRPSVTTIADMQNSERRQRFTFLASTLIALLMVCYVLVVFCFVRIRAFLKSNMVPTAGNQQDSIGQITRNLVIQAIFPLLITSILCVGILFAAVIGLTPSAGVLQFQLFFFTLVPWLPMLYPAITILTIRNYRSAAWALLRQMGGKQPNTNVNVVMPMSTQNQQQQMQQQIQQQQGKSSQKSTNTIGLIPIA